MNNLLVSPSPHIHSKENTRSLMRDVLIALVPLVLVAFYFAGLDAVKVIALSVAGCMLTEYVIQRFLRKQPSTLKDLSAVVTGVLLALNLPASSPWWMVLIGCVAAIGIAKMSFGGLGNNLFNPALVARVILLISFPVQMTNWKSGNSIFRPDFLEFPSGMTDAVSGATPLGLVKEGLTQGETISSIAAANDFSYWDMFIGKLDGTLGEISALAILLGFVYLLARRVIKPHIPLAAILTVAVFSGILYAIDPLQYADPLFHLLTGGILLGAVFMATDYVTSPMSNTGMIIYGVGIGLLTVIIRNWGAYPEGVSFAILLMNACTPLINIYFKPKRFGKELSRE